MINSRRVRVISISLAISLSIIVLAVAFTVGAVGASYTQHGTLVGRHAPPLQECPSSMISYWRLNETSGTIFADSVGDLDATCTGDTCPAFAAGAVDGALDFDGVDDGLTAPSAVQYDWSNDDSFSLELWVKTNECSGDAFLGKHSYEASWGIGCQKYNQVSNLPIFSIRDTVLTDGIRITATTPIGDNVWHHIVGVRDGQAKESRLYVDGVLEASTIYNYAGSLSNNEQLTFGFHEHKYHANAVIDEVAVYDIALAQSDIEQHYELGLAGGDYCNNIAPYAYDERYLIDKNALLTMTLQYSDLGGPGPYSFVIVDPPDHGSLSGSGGTRVYSPNRDYEGLDVFLWRVNDGLVDSNIAKVTIEVGDVTYFRFLPLIVQDSTAR